jgi:fibronectin-binding autotransporter adhesin
MKHIQKSKTGRIRLALGILAAVAAGIMPALAADRTWNGAGDGASWTDANNWGGTAPVAGDALFFDGSTGLTPNNNFAANTIFHSITFNSGAGPFTLSGAAINLTNNVAAGVITGITNNSANPQTISHNIALNGTNRYWHVTGDLTNNGSVNSSGSSPTAFRIIKSGPGTLTLAGATDNAFLAVIINEGKVVLAKTANGALGGYSTINSGGTMVIALPNQIFNRTRLNVEGGTLQVQANELIHLLSSSNTLSFSGVVENGLANTTNTLTVGSDNGTPHGIYNGTIRDGAAIGNVLNFAAVRASLVQTLNGTNTYTGTTTVNCNGGSGYARLIINGVHTGGDTYSVSGNAAGRLGALGGGGIISASAANFGVNGYLSPGGSCADGDVNVFSDTTAILTFSNAVSLIDVSSTLEAQLNNATAGSGYDQVNIAGLGSFSNNAANLKLTLGYTPATGDKFTLVKVQGTSSANNIGIFATLNGIATDLSQGATFIEPSTGKRFQISYQAEGSNFDMGAGNGNDIMLQALADAGGTLTWRGDGVNNFWDVNATANWWNGTALSVFTNNPVVFDNTGSNNTPINLTETVTPPSVLFNATNNYVLSGAGSLSGSVSISKTNTGTVAIVNDNAGLTGTTVIRNGIFQIGTNGTTGSWSGPITVNSNGVFAVNRSDDVIFTNNVSGSGTAGFLHNGSGALIINTAVPFTGRSTNAGGVFQLGDGVSTSSSIGGDVNVSGTNALRYLFPGNSATAYTTANSVSGNGTVLWDQPENPITSCFYSIGAALSSSNFNGTHIIGAGVTVHALNNNPGYAFGSNSVVIVTNLYSQVWLDSSPIPYNQSYIISGSGTPITAPGGTDVAPPYGAIKLFNNTISGAITLVGDSRIGGSSSGGTIRGQIIGNGHQLEVFGDNTVGFPFILSLTNGLNNWGNTLITWGSLRANVTGSSISTNAMTIDLNGQLQVFGNTVNVNSLHDGASGAGVVYNMNTGTAGTLAVGADGASSTFNGTFGDGATRPLNLTKVGGGTLTLSAISTNTGAITVNGGTLALTGSGSFDNATNFAVATGASLDVSGRGDGTLTLAANQTLKHSGASVGAITINGSLNMGSGSLLLGLNRANTPATNDSVVVSGTVTGGGTLTVTNLGPALQVGNTFQLFAAGVSGITANLQTVDALNGVTYTWNNNIASSGSITVASVTPIGQPTLGVSQTGNSLTFSWTGPFKLQSQTNSLSVGVSNNWGNYPGGSTSPVIVTINPANPTVFFRLSLQ